LLTGSTVPCDPRTGAVLDDTAGETSELSLEPAIEGRSDRSICDVHNGVAKKCFGTDPGANYCDKN
jgi:hypothetical protein